MKAKDFASVVQAYAAALDSVGARQGALLKDLAAVFASSTKTIAAEIKRLSETDLPSGGAGPSLREVMIVLGSLEPLLKVAGKAPVLTDTRAILTFMASRSEVGLSALRTAMSAKPATKTRSRAAVPVREDVVVQRHQLLEAALGDEARFAHVLAAVKADLTGPEIIALAKSFMGTSTRTKADALRKIESRQQYLLGSLARRAATAGRTAA